MLCKLTKQGYDLLLNRESNTKFNKNDLWQTVLGKNGDIGIYYFLNNSTGYRTKNMYFFKNNFIEVTR